jgi:hypothetical protein
MNHEEAGRLWNANAEAWTTLARSGYDIYNEGNSRPTSPGQLLETVPTSTRRC